jgi:regulatory protein
MAGKITALKVQARNKQRVNVYLDGAFAFGLAAIEAVRLKVGQALTEADVARLQGADDVEKTYERALKYLAYRPRTEAEIRRHLARQAPAATDEVLARLRRAGLVDDQAFGRFWVENRSQFRPKSGRMLKAELRQKGLTAEQADAALAESHGGDAEAAYQAAAGRAHRLAGLPQAEFARKLQGFLARRGFGYETIRETVERVWREAAAEGLAPDENRESEA